MNVLRNILLFASLGGLLACGNETDIRDYYFPTRSLLKGMVYEYEPLAGVNDHPIYWYALAVDQDTSLFLTITTYDTTFTPASLIKEEITNGGVITRELSIFATDSTGRSREAKAEVLAGNAFPFYLDHEQRPAYVYQARYAPPTDPASKITLTYNRQYDRDTSLVIMGERREAIVFSLKGETDINDPVNGSMSPQFSGYEIYAKGIGLVEDYRNFNGFVFHKRLKDRFSMQELQARAKRQ
ncbi:MAG: hypothetical protein AAF828_02500 [Bacteroidota bacterium]